MPLALLHFFIMCFSRVDCRSRARPWNRFCRSFNVNLSYSNVLSYPNQDHMTREEAELEWRAIVDYWAGSSE